MVAIQRDVNWVIAVQECLPWSVMAQSEWVLKDCSTPAKRRVGMFVIQGWSFTRQNRERIIVVLKKKKWQWHVYVHIYTNKWVALLCWGWKAIAISRSKPFLAARLAQKVHKNSSVTVSAMFPTYRLRQDSSVLGGHSTGTHLGDRSFQSLDRVSGTHCLSHCMTEISHLYSSKDFWRYFGLCRAAAHSDCCFFVPCTNILTYLLVT